MKDMELLQNIARYLSRFSDEVKLLNGTSDFSINTYAERMLIEVLNERFDKNFINMNVLASGTYPSIDLLSTDRSIGVQVTSSKNLKKVKDCLTKFITSKLYEDVNSLYIVILTDKQESYSQESINKHIDKVTASGKALNKVVFEAGSCIIDRIDLQKYFYSASTNKIEKVEKFLKNQFVYIDTKSNLSDYYKFLKDKFHEISFNDDKGMTLKDIYVKPSFEVYERRTDHNEYFFTDFGFYDSIHDYYNNKLLNQSAKDNEVNFSLVLGYPGQGKTSFCKKLLHDYLQEEKQRDRDIFYFKLKDIRQGRGLIDSPISVLHEEAIISSDTEINKLHFRKSILLLDGLDELYMKEDLKLDDIEKLCKELIAETEKNKNLSVIVTSRNWYVNLEKIKREKIRIIRLAPLNINLQQEWISKYRRFHPDSWLTPEKLHDYNSDKGAIKHFVQELIEQPLLLHMIASLKQEVSKDINRSSVYDQLFTELIERRYSSDGQIENLAGIGKDDLRELIQEIAFEIHKEGNGFINRRKLLAKKSVQDYLKKLPNKDFTESLKGVMISFYFTENENQIDTSTGEKDVAIEFLHKSLMEYMVAEKIVRTICLDILNKDKKDRFILESFHDGLTLFNELFGNKLSENEIQGYLIELIQKISEDEKEELYQRLIYFFEDFAAADFISEFSSKTSKEPMLLSLSSFIGYWLFLRNLEPELNHLISQTLRDKVAKYISILEVVYSKVRYGDFNYQDFSNSALTSIFGLGSDDIKSVNFDECDLLNTEFIGIDIINCSFLDVTAFSTGYYDLTIKNCSFSADLSQCEFENVVFDNVNFSGSYIDGWRLKNVTIKRMKEKSFYDTQIDIEDLVLLLNHGFKINIRRLGRIRSKEATDMQIDEVVKYLKEHNVDVEQA